MRAQLAYSPSRFNPSSLALSSTPSESSPSRFRMSPQFTGAALRDLVDSKFNCSDLIRRNTQNIGLQIGNHWANTFMMAPAASNCKVAMRTPPADLLVYFSSQPNWRMQVVDRTAEDPRTAVTPSKLRYVWEGTPAAGERVHSTQVYLPSRSHQSPSVHQSARCQSGIRQGRSRSYRGQIWNHCDPR